MKRRKPKNPIPGRDRQKIHAKKRFLERYGIALSDEDYGRICNAIRGRKTNGIKINWTYKESRTRSLCCIVFNGTPMIIVYSKETRRVVTALPRKCLKKDYSHAPNYMPPIPILSLATQ